MRQFQAISLALLSSALVIQACGGGSRSYVSTTQAGGPADSGVGPDTGATGGGGRGGAAGRAGSGGSGDTVDASLEDRAPDGPSTLVDAVAEAEAGSDAADAGAPECMVDAKKCDGLNPLRCSSAGRWTSVGDAPCPFLCTAGACSGTCVPGARRCGGTDGKSPQRCSDNGDWVFDGSACTSVCSNGVCTGSCPPNATQCLSPMLLQTCGQDGMWQTPAKTCVDQACVGNACAGTCAPNGTPTRCNQATPQFCNTAGQWENRAAGACSGDTPVCTNGTCGCTIGASRCKDGATLEFCVGGAWIAGNACSGNTPVCIGGSCKECSGIEARCTDNFNILQACDGNGNWVSTACAHTCSTGGHPHCATPTQVSGIVACGADLTCGSGSEGCCASPGNFHCGACDASEPQKTPYILCDGNNDCGPNFCCMVAGAYVTPHYNTYCAADCGASVQGASKFYTCDPDFPACPAGKTCTAWKDAETVIHVCSPAN